MLMRCIKILETLFNTVPSTKLSQHQRLSLNYLQGYCTALLYFFLSYLHIVLLSTDNTFFCHFVQFWNISRSCTQRLKPMQMTNIQIQSRMEKCTISSESKGLINFKSRVQAFKMTPAFEASPRWHSLLSCFLLLVWLSFLWTDHWLVWSSTLCLCKRVCKRGSCTEL